MAKKKPSKKAAAAKKKPTTAKKAARKPAAKAARKAAGKTARKAAPKKAAAKKAAPRKAAAKKAAPRKAAAKKAAPRKAAAKKAAPAPKAAPPAAPRELAVSSPSDQTVSQAIRGLRASSYSSTEPVRPLVEVVETTSAGTQPLAPEHAAVDDLTSSGNELLDIFQKYDRNRTGYIEAPGFARLLEALGQNITDDELMIAFDIIDTERSGKISWKQFKNWWTSR